MKKSLISLFLIIAAIVLAWKINFPSASWRYKITVEIETPEGIKSGSAVRQISVSPNTARWVNPDVSSHSINLKGEAVVIDLGKRGLVFGLIDWNSYEEFFSAFPRINVREYKKIKAGETALLSTERWPTFVMFKDINDPKTVALVRGGEFNKETQAFDTVDKIEELFGNGVKLKQITIEMTDEPVTWGKVNKYLSENFWQKFNKWWNSINAIEKMKYTRFFSFKKG